MAPNIEEEQFEADIVASLVATGEWNERKPSDVNVEEALLEDELFAFIEATQPSAWNQLVSLRGDDAKRDFKKRLIQERKAQGTLHLLRRQLDVAGEQFDLSFKKPAHAHGEAAIKNYEANRLTVVRQVRFNPKTNEEIDLVLYVNGIPVATLELKNAFTGQGVRNAIDQYKKDRPPTTPLTAFKSGALVHFAVDDSEVYMATRLDGLKTFFLPFNRGHNGGAGNPPVEGKHRTSYLWESILRRDSWLDILHRFMNLEVQPDGSEVLIFPRYHQLDAVRSLIDAVQEEGTGNNYLVQHSAGSGKSNTIGWLAHRLASLHDATGERIFDSVVVVTDRKVLDSQLQDTIWQIDHVEGVVHKIDKNSKQLADALHAGKRIIITTLQKFPIVHELADKLPNRRYAVIADEAHSSQTGQAASKLKAVLAPKSLEDAAEEDALEEADDNDQIADQMESRKKQPNLSFFGFTATPKFKTLAYFGRPGPDGKPLPFHLYTMRQAIEEGFILDVLRNYTPYSTFFKLVQKAGEDKEVDRAKAAAALHRYVSLEPGPIDVKTRIIVEHFYRKVRKRIGGKAKAMLVTSSRLHAVRYRRAIEAYIKARAKDDPGYAELGVLVAFSGTVNDPDGGNPDGDTEASMNPDGVSDDRLKAAFATSDYHLLVVANKYQTGFDQPLLHTMYVDKLLRGVQAVQTLSRLNRKARGKDDTFVLDFVNKPEDIQGAFQPYYERTISERPDPDQLYALKTQLYESKVFAPKEVADFIRVFNESPNHQRQLNKTHGKLYAVLDPIVDRFVEMSDEKRAGFRKTLQAFLNQYTFLIQIVDYSDRSLEELFTFGRFLLAKIRGAKTGGPGPLVGEDVELEEYRLFRKKELDISLTKHQDGEVTGPKGGGPGRAPDMGPLSDVIKKVNERFGVPVGDKVRDWLDGIYKRLDENEELKTSASVNDYENFAIAGRKEVWDELVESHDEQGDFMKQLAENAALKQTIIEGMLKQLWVSNNQEANPGA